MDLKLEMKQSQTLSQRMIQSAEILQMTSEELNTYISLPRHPGAAGIHRTAPVA